MSEKVTRSHLKSINFLLQRLTVDEQGQPAKIDRGLAYAISKNSSRMKEELDAIEVILKPFIEYEEKRVDLCRELAEKGPDGDPLVLPDGSFKGVDQHPDWKPRFEKLQAEYKDQVDQINQMLNEEIEVDFYKFDLSLLPATISKQEMDVLMPLLKDPSE